MDYDWNFSVLRPYIWDLWRGTGITLALGVGSSFLGTLFGVPTGWLLRNKRLWSPVLLVNDGIKSLPVLFLMLTCNYFPWKQVFGVTPPSAFNSALAALTLAQTAFTADIVRGAIANIQPGPMLAARALGIPEWDVWRHIALPDVFRQVVPALSAFFVGNLKLSSLASVLGVEEVMFVARVAAGQQFRALEALVVVAVIYLVVITPLTILVRFVEAHPALKRR